MLRFRMFSYFVTPLGFFFLIFSSSQISSHSLTIVKAALEESFQDKYIDVKIEELQKMKRSYEGKAAWHENQAQRLQFQEGQIQLAKKHWKMAEANRDTAKRIQQDIDRLQEQKKSRSH